MDERGQLQEDANNKKKMDRLAIKVKVCQCK